MNYNYTNEESSFSFIDVIMALALILVFIILPVVAMVGVHIKTADGEHTGYITAVEKSGLFFKTYTVYLKTDTQSSQEDKYCVIDTSLINKLKEVQRNKELVTVGFIDYVSAGIAECGEYNGGIINEIK